MPLLSAGDKLAEVRGAKINRFAGGQLKSKS
jgi:hypothetical protein